MPKPDPQPYLRLAEMILRRYRKNSHKTLADVYRLDRDFLALEPDQLEYLITNRAGILKTLDDPELFERLVALFVNASLEFTYQSNQFVQLDRPEQAILTEMYRTYLTDMREIIRRSPSIEALDKGMTALVRAHFHDLAANLARFFDHETAARVEENVILKQVVCGDYSPITQIAVLGIDLDRLAAPVLDLGCGRSARLVYYLRSMGIEAVGVDRTVERERFLVEKDWFDLRFTEKSWGTVVSHMAFSNHFIFHHLYKNGDPNRYARLYMSILGSLRPGGVFCYAPGLPFIEQFLPEALFTVEKRELTGMPIPEDPLQRETWYAARVVKRAS
jgi:SAM-dependent methyltransferase